MRISVSKKTTRLLLKLLFCCVLIIGCTTPVYADSIPTSVGSFLYTICVGFGGLFLWVGGSLLDYTVIYLVIGMGNYLEANLGVVVDELWVVVRDLFNIFFIFGLIYIGFRTILFSNDTSTKKALGYLIIAALMINFSLFITKAIIDFSNIAAFQIHTAMMANVAADTSTITVSGGDEGGATTVTFGGADQKSVTAAFMNATKLPSFADGSLLENIRGETDFISGRFIMFGILMMFFMIFAGFVFASGAVILIGRFIALIIFMILSPMMFLGLMSPLAAKQGKEWWTKFLKYAFVAPAYLFMLYLSLWALSGIGVNGTFAEAYEQNAASNGAFMIILYFFLVTGFLVASLKVAQMMGAYGANAAYTMTKNGGDRIMRQASYMARFPDRGIRRWAVGRTAGAVGKGLKNWQSRSSAAGTGSKIGDFARSAVKATEADHLVLEHTDMWENWKPEGLHRSLGDIDNFREERQKRTTQKAAENKRLTDIDTVINPTGGTTPTADQLKDMVSAIGDLTTEQMKDMDINILTKEEVALHLSADQIDDLEKTGKYSDQQIGDIKTAKKKAMKQVATTGTRGNQMVGTQTQRQLLAQRGSKEFAKMPDEVFTDAAMAPHLTPTMVEAKMKDGKIADPDLQTMSKNIDNQILLDRLSPSGPGAYTKQWQSWEKHTPLAARLNLQNT